MSVRGNTNQNPTGSVAVDVDPVGLNHILRPSSQELNVYGMAAGLGIEVLMLVYGSDAVSQASLAPTIGVMAGSIMSLNSAWGNYQLVRMWHAIREGCRSR